MAISLAARRLLMGRSMTLAAVAATKLIPPTYAFCISRLGGYRNCSFKVHGVGEIKDENCSPKAWMALKTAKVIAKERQLKSIEPECLMLALLKPNQRVANDVLVEADCDISFMTRRMQWFLCLQPKKTDYWLWKMLRDDVLLRYYGFLWYRGWSSSPWPDDPCLNEVDAEPKCNIGPLLAEAYLEMKNMGDNLIGEEHLLIAYHKDLRFGRKVFNEMNVQENDLKSAVQAIRSNLSAVQAIRSNLKKQEDHVKEEDDLKYVMDDLKYVVVDDHKYVMVDDLKSAFQAIRSNLKKQEDHVKGDHVKE